MAAHARPRPIERLRSAGEGEVHGLLDGHRDAPNHDRRTVTMIEFDEAGLVDTSTRTIDVVHHDEHLPDRMFEATERKSGSVSDVALDFGTSVE